MIDHKETIKNCIVMLGSIRVPMMELDAIGAPIVQVRNALIEILNDMNKPDEPEENIKMAGEQDGETEAE